MMKKRLKPESLMMSHGYRPEWSEGALKCPIYQTSTFVFNSAEEGKAFFELAYGLRAKDQKEQEGLIYSRINNPDLEILENRLCLWDEAEEAAVFESGMSAITTALIEFLKPGDVLLYSNPVYGGTDHFIKHFLPEYGIVPIGFSAVDSKKDIHDKLRKSGVENRLSMVFIETPANPTNDLIDISMMKELSDQIQTQKEVILAVDNTYLGPVWQHPLKQGADLVLYSATKYIGGHSDVIAGACLGPKSLIKRVKTLRTFFGNMASPWTGWLLMRSLETLKLRMEQQVKNAEVLARFLNQHPKIEHIHYLGLLDESNPTQFAIYQKQCLAPGAMVSFKLKGTEKEAFQFLNHLKLIKLAVSLGGTESLAQHPATMTHAGVLPEEKEIMGITENLVRISVGVENVDDIVWDVQQSLEHVDVIKKDDPQAVDLAYVPMV